MTATLAGVLFGALAGTVLALAAALLGAGLCLLAARYLGADAVGSLLVGARGQRWRSWMTAHGFGAVLASRLAPGVPAGMVNYLGGLAGHRAAGVPRRGRARRAPEDRRLRRAGRRAGRSAFHPRRACRRPVRRRRGLRRARRALARPLSVTPPSAAQARAASVAVTS